MLTPPEVALWRSSILGLIPSFLNIFCLLMKKDNQ